MTRLMIDTLLLLFFGHLSLRRNKTQTVVINMRKYIQTHFIKEMKFKLDVSCEEPMRK